MPAHYLRRKCEIHPVAHFVGGFKVKEKYTLKAVLPNGSESASCKMLSHEHTEHRRCFRIFYIRRCYMDPCRACTCAEHKLLRTLFSADSHYKLLS